MSGAAPDDVEVRLPGSSASVGAARRLVAGALDAWGLDELVDEAVLLVSEVVTNAVVHAGSEIGLRVTQRPAGARVEVRDASAVVPTHRHFTADAPTGRGLGILDRLASGWGVVPADAGKVVWFEVGAAADGHVAPVPSPATARALVEVALLGLPVALVRSAVEYGDALLRELFLLSVSDDAEALSTGPGVTPQLDLGQVLEAADRAANQGRQVVDVTVRLPASAADAALERLALIDEADRLAGEGRLLVPPALPEIGQCRRWLLGQIVAQGRGGSPDRWEAPDDGAEVGERRLTPADLAALEPDAADSIVVDDGNRIVFAGQRAATVVGWDPDELAGRRLTVIVPPELREAHLVGYTRYALTRQSAILGRPVQVPALRPDGSQVQVTLVIRRVALPDAGRMFAATVREAPAVPGRQEG